MFALLGSVCEVAVFPPMEYPSIYAFFPEPFGHNAFQQHLHCLGSFFRHDSAFRLIPELLDHIPFCVQYGHSQMRGHPASSVYNGTDCSCHLDRRDLKRLPESHCRKLYGSDVFPFMHDCSSFPGQIHSCQFQKSELFKIIIKPVTAQPQPDIHKYGIAGILYSFYKGLCSMSSHLMAADLPVFYNPVSRDSTKVSSRAHYTFLQTC